MPTASRGALTVAEVLAQLVIAEDELDRILRVGVELSESQHTDAMHEIRDQHMRVIARLCGADDG